MIWTSVIHEKPNHFDTRLHKGFAFLPKRVTRERIVWFQHFKRVEMYHPSGNGISDWLLYDGTEEEVFNDGKWRKPVNKTRPAPPKGSGGKKKIPLLFNPNYNPNVPQGPSGPITISGTLPSNYGTISCSGILIELVGVTGNSVSAFAGYDVCNQDAIGSEKSAKRFAEETKNMNLKRDSIRESWTN